MKINVFSDAALRALMVLAADSQDHRSTRELSAATGIPQSHISKVITKLSEHGYVSVTRGRNGGSAITALGRTASLGHIMRNVNQREDVAECNTASGACPLIGECRLRAEFNRAREAFYEALGNVTITDMIGSRSFASAFQSIPVGPPAM